MDEKVGLECQDKKAAEILDRSVYRIETDFKRSHQTGRHLALVKMMLQRSITWQGTHIINNSGTAQRVVAILLQETFFGTLERGASPRHINTYKIFLLRTKTIKHYGLCFGVRASVLLRHTAGHDAARCQSMKDTVRDIANPTSNSWAGGMARKSCSCGMLWRATVTPTLDFTSPRRENTDDERRRPKGNELVFSRHIRCGICRVLHRRREEGHPEQHPVSPNEEVALSTSQQPDPDTTKRQQGAIGEENSHSHTGTTCNTSYNSGVLGPRRSCTVVFHSMVQLLSVLDQMLTGCILHWIHEHVITRLSPSLGRGASPLSSAGHALRNLIKLLCEVSTEGQCQPRKWKRCRVSRQPQSQQRYQLYKNGRACKKREAGADRNGSCTRPRATTTSKT